MLLFIEHSCIIHSNTSEIAASLCLLIITTAIYGKFQIAGAADHSTECPLVENNILIVAAGHLQQSLRPALAHQRSIGACYYISFRV